MSYKGRYSSSYRSKGSSSRPIQRKKSTATGYGAYSLGGRGAYRPRPVYQRKRNVASGRGAYYIKGNVGASAKLPFGKFSAGLDAGYMSGLGAYNISAIRHNVLIKPDIPEVRNTVYMEGGTVIRHREYLGPITSSATAAAFKLQTYMLNPAQSNTFPWLSSIASNFEEYKPNGIMFEFRSTASDAIASSTNLALGQVMMCTQYDPTDPEFSSDIDLLNYTWAQSGKVSDNVQHFIECDPKQSPLSNLYTREGGYSSQSDLRFSDFGRFSIATSGLQGTSVQVGQLWVTYEFIMFKPKIGAPQAEAGGWFHFYNNVGVSDTSPFGVVASGNYDSENNLSIVVADNGIYGDITLPAQYKPATFQVQVSYQGSAATCVGPSFGYTTDTGITFIDRANDNADALFSSPVTGTSATRCTSTTWIDVAGDGIAHVLKVASPYIPTSTPGVDLYICQIPYVDPNSN